MSSVFVVIVAGFVLFGINLGLTIKNEIQDKKDVKRIVNEWKEKHGEL